MTTAEHPLRPARSVALSKQRWLVVGFEQGRYAVAYYRPAKPWKPDADAHKVNRMFLEKTVPQGVVLSKLEYLRFAAWGRTLSEALQIALGDGGFNNDTESPDLVEAFIRSTEWGLEIPTDAA